MPSTTTTIAERFARGDPDGVLTIGVLLPRTGTGAALGEPLSEAIRGAVQAVNTAGGVAGNDVQLLVFDEASPTSVDDLLGESSIDAVIGPLSSRNALAMLPTITDAGVAACSPMATSIALTDMPDNGLFFRTVPSDALQARLLAREVNRTGLGAAALVYTDDVYGRPFATAVRAALDGQEVQIMSELAYRPDDDDFSDEAAAIVAAAPPVVALIGDAESGGRMVAAILAAEGDTPLIVANDAVRVADFGTRVDAEALSERVSGVSVSAFSGSANLEPMLPSDVASAAFAAAAVDCVNLLALGATAGDTPDDPAVIAAQAMALSVGGVPCQSFTECLEAMESGLEVDYNGPTGQITLDVNGDVTRAWFDLYRFDESGNDETDDVVSFPN